MAFDYSKLRGRIKEVFGDQDNFGKSINLSSTSVSLKLNNKREWSQQEINKATEVLGIPDDQIHAYFFTEKV